MTAPRHSDWLGTLATNSILWFSCFSVKRNLGFCADVQDNLLEEMFSGDALHRGALTLPSLKLLCNRLRPKPVVDPLLDGSGKPLSLESIFRYCLFMVTIHIVFFTFLFFFFNASSFLHLLPNVCQFHLLF